MRRACCPACGHVVAVSGGPRFYEVHDHQADGEPLAFAAAGVRCAGSGDYVPAHHVALLSAWLDAQRLEALACACGAKATMGMRCMACASRESE